MKSIPLLVSPAAVTSTFPDEAPEGTFVTIDEAVQLTTIASVPANVTDPAVEPKFVPAIVTNAPTTPDEGYTLAMAGAGGIVTTLKLTPLLAVPPTVTTTLPLEAPAGTLVAIEELLQVVTVAVVPLNVTVPPLEPKLAPVIVTAAPTAPELGEMPAIAGAEVDGVMTLKLTSLLSLPFAVITTFPVFAPEGTAVAIAESVQLVTLAAVPSNVTVPALEPKFVPVIVTTAPTAPEFGEMLVIVGVALELVVGPVDELDE